MVSSGATDPNKDAHTRTYFPEEQIVVLVGSGSMHPDAVDAFAELCIDTMKNPQYGSPFYAIVNISNPRQGFTPYSNKRFLEVMRNFRPDYQYFVGIVVTNYISQLLLNTFLKPWLARSDNLEVRFFNDEVPTRKWLGEVGADS